MHPLQIVPRSTATSELGRIKAADLAGTGAALVSSANIGCTMQLRRHLDGEAAPVLPVRHPIQLLDQSWRAGGGS